MKLEYLLVSTTFISFPIKKPFMTNMLDICA